MSLTGSAVLLTLALAVVVLVMRPPAAAVTAAGVTGGWARRLARGRQAS
jgi:hypothetical protein